MVTVVPKKLVLSSAAHREPDGADREAETDRTVICNVFGVSMPITRKNTDKCLHDVL